jgi:ATP-dependent Clp protease ATP-binding subunit ClpA
MRLLSRKTRPHAKTLRPAEGYLISAAAEARRRRCQYIGTEHLLFNLLQQDAGRATSVLRRLRVRPDEVLAALERWLGEAEPAIDAAALATLGIDYEAVVAQLEATFGEGALERTRASCLKVCPRAKRALAFAVDAADGGGVLDDHVLLGLLREPDSAAARVLAEFGVTLEAAQAGRIGDAA